VIEQVLPNALRSRPRASPRARLPRAHRPRRPGPLLAIRADSSRADLPRTLRGAWQTPARPVRSAPAGRRDKDCYIRPAGNDGPDRGAVRRPGSIQPTAEEPWRWAGTRARA